MLRTLRRLRPHEVLKPPVLHYLFSDDSAAKQAGCCIISSQPLIH
jgi:hypothetical protein